MKRKHSCGFAIVLLFVLLSPVWTAAHKSSPIASRATIFFLDGTNVVISNPVFVYKWSRRLQAANWNQTRSDDFHYCEVVQNVELDQTIPGKDIQSLELYYPKTEISEENMHFAPEKIKITLLGGSETIVPRKNLIASSEFLLGKSLEDIEDRVYFQALEIHGVAIIGGKSGLFRGRLSAEQGPYLRESDAIKKVLFLEKK